MDIQKFYEEIEIVKTKNLSSTKVKEVEETLDYILNQYFEVMYFKHCIKKIGVKTLIAYSKAGSTITSNDIKDMVKGREEDLISAIKYVESIIGVERLIISNWLNQKCLESSINQEEEKHAIYRLRSFISNLSNSRNYYNNIANLNV